MITVRGLPILTDEIEILQIIRERVLLEQGRHILRKIKRSGNNIMVCCPVHSDGQEKKPSCGISTVERKGHPAGTFNCFSCEEKGTFELFVAKCFGRNDASWGQKWLIDNFITGETYERPDISLDFNRNNVFKKIEKPKYITEEELSKYRYYHPYMWERKLTPEIVEKYDIGYQKDFRFEYKENGITKFLAPQEVLTFPVKDEKGNCLFVSRRAIHNKTFFLPLNIEKPVYGIYELPENCKTVVICESVFNALTCVAYGIPAVALFGTGNFYQHEILNKLPIRQYIIGLDPDRAGNTGTQKLKQNLKNKILTKLNIPVGKDINDLSKEEFLSLSECYL